MSELGKTLCHGAGLLFHEFANSMMWMMSMLRSIGIQTVIGLGLFLIPYLSLPKIPSEWNSVHSSEVLATTGISGLAGTCPTGANRESEIGCQETPRHINPQCETGPAFKNFSVSFRPFFHSYEADPSDLPALRRPAQNHQPDRQRPGHRKNPTPPQTLGTAAAPSTPSDRKICTR
jgi:hypothetical protein